MSTGNLPITREGYDKLVADLKHYKSVERPAVIQAIQEARAQGDLSENAEYDAAKEKQGKIEDKISELEDKIARAHIIEADASASETIIFGATVCVKDSATGKEIEYQLVGPEDVDVMRNRISINSPIGKALVGKRRGDTVEVSTPRGTKTLTVQSYR
ncbi:MAG TPA: transcription elongation factor GreA [Fibrobacteria bacterium]|mgnify:CR=1 FL=1|nr:transcription elongation factor GreA [Fibrobacteria bacterium]HOX52174.1 transcription elongation factor GreA [Fibrobacteria bacterium]